MLGAAKTQRARDSWVPDPTAQEHGAGTHPCAFRTGGCSFQFLPKIWSVDSDVPKEDVLGHFIQKPDCPTPVGAGALAQVLGTGPCSPSLWEAKRCREAISLFFFSPYFWMFLYLLP